jgi:hypothetical protein
MLPPLGNPRDALDLDADHIRASQAPDREHEQATAEHRLERVVADDDLQRLESSVQWLKRESMIARIETGPGAQEANRRLPRASQLPPASGIAAVAQYGIAPFVQSGIPTFARTESSGHKRETGTFQVRPPRAFERLRPPPPPRQRRTHLSGALFVLIAGVIAGSITYHIAAGGVFPAPEPAQAAPLRAQ